MNHTERIHQVARQVRGLTRALAREAVERYLASAAQELAAGQWISLPGIGRLQIVARQNGGRLLSRLGDGRRSYWQPGLRLQARLRMTDSFRALCRAHLVNPASTRTQPGEASPYPGSARNQTGKERV
jgi:hypothetical protein